MPTAGKKARSVAAREAHNVEQKEPLGPLEAIRRLVEKGPKR
jgi:hypothetical protein